MTRGREDVRLFIVEHVFYENNRQLRIRSHYAHLLERSVSVGEAVTRRQRIGSIGKDPDATFTAHLHLELRWELTLEPTYWPSSNERDLAWIQEHYADPSQFISAHRHLPTPQTEAALAVIDPISRRLRLYAEGKARGTYEVSFGQASGQKEKKGDLRTPRGMYFVVERRRGAIAGDYGEYFGGAWIKLNYPNPFDAARGMKTGLVSSHMVEAIKGKWLARQLTPQDTVLGGGIGLHGWIEEWPNDGPRALSWGCVVMHLSDISDIFGALPVGAMVVIL